MLFWSFVESCLICNHTTSSSFIKRIILKPCLQHDMKHCCMWVQCSWTSYFIWPFKHFFYSSVTDESFVGETRFLAFIYNFNPGIYDEFIIYFWNDKRSWILELFRSFIVWLNVPTGSGTFEQCSDEAPHSTYRAQIRYRWFGCEV